jgi:[acyl-carrier-protein] S-malonyltransferase
MKIALLFPGYGSQFVGMGKDLYDEYRIVQEYFEEASSCLDTNFVKLCFASSDIELGKMAHAYTSLFLVGSSVYAILKEAGIEPDIVAGYNDGETTALFAASCFSLPDGLYLLNKFCSFYQEFMDQHDVDALSVSGIATAQLENMCVKASNEEHKVFVAIYNGPMEHIVAGDRIALSALQDMIDGAGETDYVGAEVGLHSVLMDKVVSLYKEYLEKVDFKDLKIPMISCIDGEEITQGIDTKERFIRHISFPLEFTKLVRKLAAYDCIIVAAPSRSLIEKIKQQYPEKMIIAIEKKSDIDKLKEITTVKEKLDENGN